MSCPITKFLVAVPAGDLKAFQENCSEYVVLFTMNGCGWCEKIRPITEDAMKTSGGAMPVVEIVYQDNKDFVNKLGITGFPEIRKFSKSGHKTFSGPRTKEKIVQFLKRS